MSVAGPVTPSTPDAFEAPAPLNLQRAEVWLVLLDRSDQIADSITLTIFERNPAWFGAESAHELRADVRTSTRKHIRRGLLTMAGHAEPADQAKHIWRATGRRRAQQGVPMEIVLGAYTLGTRALWEALLEHRGRPDIDDSALFEAAQQVWHSLDVQNAVFAEAYRTEAERMQRQDLHRQLHVLDGLASGRAADPTFAAEAAEALGVGVDEPVLCVVTLSDVPTVNPVRQTEDRLESARVKSYWHVRGGHAVGLVPLGDDDGSRVTRVRNALQVEGGGRVGIAVTSEGLSGYAAAHHLALRAGQSLPPGADEVVDIADRLPEALLVASPEISSLLVEFALGGLLTQPEAARSMLLETLRVLLRHDNSPTHAATELICHRNTVLYRRQQIERLSGRSLSVARDRMLFGLALMRLASVTPSAPPA